MSVFCDYILGPTPNPIKGTRAVIKLNTTRKRIEGENFWGANILDSSSDLILEVIATISRTNTLTDVFKPNLIFRYIHQLQHLLVCGNSKLRPV